jgi:hypothetical protein
LGWQWLTLIFVGISICIFGCSNRNGDYRKWYSSSRDIFNGFT